MDIDREALEEWQKNQPLCILSLDPADRAVLRVAGRNKNDKKSVLVHLAGNAKYLKSSSAGECCSVIYLVTPLPSPLVNRRDQPIFESRRFSSFQK